VVAVAVHPGWTKTDMGNESARFYGMAEAVVEVGDSVRAVFGIVSFFSCPEMGEEEKCEMGDERANAMTD